MLKTVTLGLGVAVAIAIGGASAETPRRGGTIRYVAPFSQNFTSMDIHATSFTQDVVWARAIHRSLYTWDSNLGKPRLELATAVSVSPDGLVYTYKLRQDAYFHHGRRMTADDIIWTYARIMSPTASFPGARVLRQIKGASEVEQGLESMISGLRKIDDFTLEITFVEKVDPAFLLNAFYAAIYPADEASKESFYTKPIGLGPFKFVEHVPGSRLVAERWEKFYIPGKPYADKLIISLMVDPAARDVAFRNKELDAIILGPAQYATYKADPKLSKTLIEVPEMFTRYMGMNPKFPPFSDKRVRQAINYAIDSDLIIKTLLKGKAYRATSWLSPSTAAYGEELQPYPYDPEKAKKLLAEAGYADGFTFEWTAIIHEGIGGHIAEAVIPMLEKVGIKVKIKMVESAVLTESIRAGNFQAYGFSQGSGPDPLRVLRCFHSATTQALCNYNSFDNFEFDTLFDEAVRTEDTSRRMDLLAKANALVQEQAPVWFFNYNKAVMAHQPWLHGLQKNATELADQLYEDLWVDKSSPEAK